MISSEGDHRIVEQATKTAFGVLEMKKITPVLFVESLEPCLGFWVDRLGFEIIAEVPTDPSKDPAGQSVGFIILTRDDVTVMLQTRASVDLDIPGALSGPLSSNGVSLYVEVDDLAPILIAIEGCEVTLPERTTFYGKHEIGVRSPGGFSIVFAAPAE